EVELGRVICAPRRWRPRSGKANRRTRLRSSSRRYRFCPSHGGRIGNEGKGAVDGIARISGGQLRPSRSISLPGSFPTRDRRRRSGLAKAARGLPQWGSAWRVGPGRPRRDACASTCPDGDCRGARHLEQGAKVLGHREMLSEDYRLSLERVMRVLDF
ncbi:MAG: hypothetical protein OXE85_10460, partial [Roseovarius sp.]|nr:hypothetical protein [Roseovarius sp.]